MALDAQGNEVGKLFVGGLHQSTNTDGLHTYFSKYGDIEESIVMMDNRTGRSRGFGYVKFKEPTAVDQVLLEKIHVIDNKEVDPKRCNVNMRGKNRRSLKIFVGGIAFDHDEETIRSYFQTFGNVTDVNLLSNPGRPRHRGFAFVGFDDEEVVKKLIKMHFVNLNGKQVEIKPMEPPNPQKPPGSYMPPGMLGAHHPGRPVRGGGRMNPLNSHNLQYGSWNQWSHRGSNGNCPDMGGAGGGTDGWNHLLPQSWNTQPIWNSPHQGSSTGNGQSSPCTGPTMNGWDSQMAAAAAAFQQNGGYAAAPQHQWGSHQQNRRSGGSGIEHGLIDYNSWAAAAATAPNHHQGGAGGSGMTPNHHHHQPTADIYAQQAQHSQLNNHHHHNQHTGSSVFGNSTGNNGWGAAAAATGNGAASVLHGDQWGAPASGLWGSSVSDQNGGMTMASVTSPTGFKVHGDGGLYGMGASGVGGHQSGCSGGFPPQQQQTGGGTGNGDWQSALTAAATYAAAQHQHQHHQQRSFAAAAVAQQQQQQLKR